MSQVPKPNQSSVPFSGQSVAEDFDVEALMAKCGEVLRREIAVLLRLSSTGAKLEPASARDLVAYTKLLSEIRETQKDEFKNLTDKELADIVNKE